LIDVPLRWRLVPVYLPRRLIDVPLRWRLVLVYLRRRLIHVLLSWRQVGIFLCRWLIVDIGRLRSIARHRQQAHVLSWWPRDVIVGHI
jgi:hypothetical protein